MKFLLKLFALLVIVVLIYGVYCELTPPPDLYVQTQAFAACPPRPSCVSSVAEDDRHRVAGLGYTGDANTAFSMLHEVVEREGGTVLNESPNYIHAVFTTPTLRLRDDVELLILPEGRIDVRSASRFGYDDFGLNRQRVEKLRQAFEAIPHP